MRLNGKRLSSVILLVLWSALSLSPLRAADYPTKPIRLIVPFPAGSVTDIQARVIAQKLSQRFGHQMVTDNRGGADGRVGVELLSKSPADGYTIGMGTIGTLAIAPLLYPKLNYDPVHSFAPITRLTTSPYLVVVHPAVPAGTLKEFVEHAKAKPGQLNFAGGNQFVKLVLELFNSSAGVKIIGVPYQGAVAAVTDLLAGRVQLMIESPAAFRQEIQAGKLKALAVADTKRYAQLPNVPTTSEAGMPGFEARTWFGMIAPKGVPAQVVRLLNAEVNQALGLKDVREGFAAQGLDAAGTTAEAFAAFMHEERVKWERVVKSSGIKFD